MITKLISSKAVVAKVIADLNLQEKDMRMSDIVTWIGEAALKIGSVNQLVHKVSGIDGVPVIQLIGHQAQLPCDLYRLNQVAYGFTQNGPWLPMRKATGAFDVWGTPNDSVTPEVIVPDQVMIDTIKSMYNVNTNEEALAILNDTSNVNLRVILSNLINKHTTVSVDGRQGSKETNFGYNLQYSIKPGYIMTNIPTGYLKLSYHANPTDEDGYPLIPNMPSYFEACYWYVVMKLKYPDWLNGTLTSEKYYHMQRSWNFYCKQAYGDSLAPNYDEMESIKNTWLKIYPEVNDHSTFYSTTGERQHIYNKD